MASRWVVSRENLIDGRVQGETFGVKAEMKVKVIKSEDVFKGMEYRKHQLCDH